MPERERQDEWQQQDQEERERFVHDILSRYEAVMATAVLQGLIPLGHDCYVSAEDRSKLRVAVGLQPLKQPRDYAF